MMALLLGALAGGLVGACAGLLPGLHPNAVAALLLGALPALPALPEPLAAAVVAMSVAHLLGSAVPATFLGAPAPEQGMSVLPAQRMLHEGRAVEAVELGVLGACAGALAALLLALPLRLALGADGEGYRWLEPALPVFLVALVVVLLGTERKRVPSRRAVRALPFAEPGHVAVAGVLRERRGDVLFTDTGR
ncbi:MAG: tripartite tricarboxylate transporter permease, partial [Halobacteriales archaeon]|nr:tripartite tricarboxylate transporter permease [Halobacteriales archaeon]